MDFALAIDPTQCQNIDTREFSSELLIHKKNITVTSTAEGIRFLLTVQPFPSSPYMPEGAADLGASFAAP